MKDTQKSRRIIKWNEVKKELSDFFFGKTKLKWSCQLTVKMAS